jgi:hypothetical protein
MILNCVAETGLSLVVTWTTKLYWILFKVMLVCFMTETINVNHWCGLKFL